MKLTTTRARVPPIQVAKNIKRMLDVFFVRKSIFSYCQSLAKSSFGWSQIEQHHKIEKKRKK
jgi:hypothetical protein